MLRVMRAFEWLACTFRIRVIALIPACGIAHAQLNTGPRADFLRLDYGPQLPAKYDGGTPGNVSGSSAASTGDGGWLTCWSESGNDGGARLMARLLPPAFDSPPAFSEGSWTGNAALPVSVVTGALSSFTTVAGQAKALLAWAEPSGVRAQWFDQNTGGPAGAALTLGAGGSYLAGAAGNGTLAWLLAQEGGASSGQRGWVLERTTTGSFVVTPFAVQGGLFPYLHVTANSGYGLLSSHFYDYAQGVQLQGVRTAAVDPAGGVSLPHEMELPADSFWLGAMPYGSGYFGVWTVAYPNQAQLIYGREMTRGGEWAPGSSAGIVAPVSSTGAYPSLTPGPGASVLLAEGRAYLLRPFQPLSLIQTITYYEGYSLSASRILSLHADGSGHMLATRKTFDYDSTKPDHTAFLSVGSGRQSDPSLAWTRRGPQIVCQLDGYGTLHGLRIAGCNKPASTESGVQFQTGEFSSPVQTWQGNLQCIAYRHPKNIPGLPFDSADPDDVYAVLYAAAEDGTLTAVRSPFLIAGGPGSQRGVSVAPHYSGTGFMAVWREEQGSVYEGTYLTKIRAAFISGSGVVTPQGGQLVDISVGELSAPSVAGNGVAVYKAPQIPGASQTTIRLARLSVPGTAITYRNISPPEHNAVNPQVWTNGSFSMVAWRDKASGRMYVHREGGYPTLPTSEVSPPGQRILEPRLASLSYDRAAAFWIETQIHSQRLWMAVVSQQEVSSPALVMEGWFDDDTLAVSGDGAGRIAIAVRDQSTNSKGLKVLMIAPLVSQQGGLSISRAGTDVDVSWESDGALFPFAASTVEASTDLMHWLPLSGGPPFYQAPNRAVLRFPIGDAASQRYFRLRPVLNAGP